MPLGSTQLLVKMNIKNIPGGKGGRCVRLTSPPLSAECHAIWEPKPPGTLWAKSGLLRDSFTLTWLFKHFTKVITSDIVPEIPSLIGYFTLTYLQCTYTVYYMLKHSYSFLSWSI
jgi:hypothetical protein